MIYLDSAATTPIAPEVLDAMLPYLKEQYGNAGSLHKLGRQSAHAIEGARNQVSKLFSCNSENIVFTSGGSEGNNLALKGIAKKLLEMGKFHLILSATEHDSTIKAAEALTKDGFYITYVKPDKNGCITPEIVGRAIQPDTGFTSIIFSNNETGTINDIAGIGELCNNHGILFHSDCVQAAGQFVIDVEKYHLDFATVSAHKIYGPKGMGALYIREKNIFPLIYGGAEQEYGLRGGTENVPSIVGFGVACENAISFMADNLIKMTKFKQLFIQNLAEKLLHENLNDAGVHCNGYTYLNPGKVLNLRIDGVFGETLVLLMDTLGVCISAGSACDSRKIISSHVLIAHGLTDTEAKSSVRISFSKYNTDVEVTQAAILMAECVELLRSNNIGEDFNV